jgi:excisionase family DNA binding protein
MTDSAQIRRSPKLRRIFPSLRQVRLEPPRERSEWLAHLTGMSETSQGYPGLEPVLTTSELAAHLGVPVQTIHDLRHARRGPRGFRVGREMRYRLSEVQAWVEAMEAHDHAADLVDGVLR